MSVKPGSTQGDGHLRDVILIITACGNELEVINDYVSGCRKSCDVSDIFEYSGI